MRRSRDADKWIGGAHARRKAFAIGKGFKTIAQETRIALVDLDEASHGRSDIGEGFRGDARRGSNAQCRVHVVQTGLRTFQIITGGSHRVCANAFPPRSVGWAKSPPSAEGNPASAEGNRVRPRVTLPTRRGRTAWAKLVIGPAEGRTRWAQEISTPVARP